MTEVRDVTVNFGPQLQRSVSEDRFVGNDPERREKVVATLRECLAEANQFDAAIAFVTKGGVMAIYQALRELVERGGRIRLVASDYLAFTDPLALSQLMALPSTEVRLLQGASYHGKLYVFDGIYGKQVMVGSSNLTASAISTNHEVNFLYSGVDSRVELAVNEFSRIWSAATQLDETLLTKYRQKHNAARQGKLSHVVHLTKFSPNALQRKALAQLDQFRADGKNRGLIVSATGTGKTVLSAFDVRAMKATTCLFLVHRATIAAKSMETYQRVLHGQVSFGLLGGGRADNKADFLFSTVQTVSQDRWLAEFAPDRFDYIVVDETHRAASSSYAKLLGHFKPKFLLGMTATPERTDGRDVFELFDHNIVCDIRLNDALEADVLCPFHYFGIADLTYSDGENIALEDLTSQRRFEHIFTESQRLGADDEEIKGLCFVSRVEEAEALADYLSKLGLPARFLSGRHSEPEKLQAISDLESGRLAYLISVDVLNEGVDIPPINQIVMARPTQSAIVFVQQLGRGLRKFDGKRFLTVIDFVGNHKNNFMIPVALFGDRTRNKDTLRRLTREAETGLPGASTVSFDRIAKERIFKAIQASKKVGIGALKSDYLLVRKRLARSPSLMDLVAHGELDPIYYARQSQIKSLHEFAVSYDPGYPLKNLGKFPLLGWLMQEALDGVHGHEAVALFLLLRDQRVSDQSFAIECGLRSVPYNSIHDLDRALHVLSLKYGQPKGSSGADLVAGYNAGRDLLVLGRQEKSLLKDAIDFSLYEFGKRLTLGRLTGNFVVGAKYTYKETFRLLGWKRNPNPQNIGGYFLSRATNDLAIFVNYNKNDAISATTQYEDRFLDRQTFHWTTKNSRSLDSPEVMALRAQVASGLKVPLFIRKEAESEGSSRYFLGNMKLISGSQSETEVGGKKAVCMDFRLDHPVPRKLFDHIVS